MPREIPAAYVYRLHSPNGKLVYVGMTTGRVRDRLRVHRNRSGKWWHKVDPNLTTATAYATPEEADFARLEAIRTEHPSDNVHHAYVVKVIAMNDRNAKATIAQRAGESATRRAAIRTQQQQYQQEDELQGGYIKREPTPPPVRRPGIIWSQDEVIAAATVSPTGREFYGTVVDPNGIDILGADGETVITVTNERYLRLNPKFHTPEDIALYLGVTLGQGQGTDTADTGVDAPPADTGADDTAPTPAEQA